MGELGSQLADYKEQYTTHIKILKQCQCWKLQSTEGIGFYPSVLLAMNTDAIPGKMNFVSKQMNVQSVAVESQIVQVSKMDEDTLGNNNNRVFN